MDNNRRRRKKNPVLLRLVLIEKEKRPKNQNYNHKSPQILSPETDLFFSPYGTIKISLQHLMRC